MGQDSDTQRLTQDIERTREDLTYNVDALADRVSPSRVVERKVENTKQSTRSAFSRLRNSVMGSSQSAGSNVSGKASSAKEGLSETASSAADSASSAAESVKQQAQGNPLAAGLVAFGVGWLVSSLIPVSEKEVRASQKLEEAAKEHGQGVAEAAKQAGAEVGGSLKEKATEAAQDLKESAQESTERVKGEGTSSAQTVKDDAQSR